jgi:antitoxin component YwqK of YwqJK toxin-antitoxin module
MGKLLAIITLILPLLLSSESWAIDFDDLVKREGLYYEKFTEVPFTGTTTGKTQVSFKDGKFHGEWVRYYENGKLESKRNFKNGEKHGEDVSYYENGQLFIKENYVNGEEHGELVMYHENGQLKYKFNFVNGELVD